MSNDEWYYAQNGHRIGPVSMAAVQSLLSRQLLSVEDYVWTTGMPDWSPAATVPELSAAATSAAATAVSTATYPSPSQQAFSYPSYGTPGAGPVSYYTPAPAGGFPAVMPFAGFWLRVVAWLLDCLILWGMLIGVGFVVGFILAFSLAGSRRGPAGPGIVALPLAIDLVALVGVFLYFTLQESSAAQATWGKRALGLVVTNEAGGRITYGQAVGRFFGKWVSGIILYIGFMMAGWTMRKQALHDMMAGTLVMRRR